MKSVKFTKWEIQSILDGTKTQFRIPVRINDPNKSSKSIPAMQSAIDEAKSAYPDGSDRGWIFWVNSGDPQETRRLYPELAGFECPYGYIGDKIEIDDAETNIKLEIVGVSVERLQSLSIDDVKSEGIQSPPGDWKPLSPGNSLYSNGYGTTWIGWKSEFESHWDSKYGLRAWNKNPWVWVIKFTQVKK